MLGVLQADRESSCAMTILRRLLRVSLIGTALGACVGAVIYQTKQTERIREVRSRIEPSLKQELATAQFALGDPAFIRIFKEERELELWLKPHGEKQYKLWKTWPIVAMSGKLGPKLQEGDQQAPEGFYAVTAKALNPQSDYHLSFNIGYPNEFDQAQGRTGSFIMVHGNNVSIGCFAMTDPVIEQIYLVVEAALNHGQASVPVHIFPFRMTAERMEKAETEGGPWLAFWKNLRKGHDRFEAQHVPPLAKPDGELYAFPP
jgi:murein L,D-transpeptidase YafK